MAISGNLSLVEAIQARRSIRAYKPGEISREQVEALLEAAMLAPSANNSRPWEFVVVESRDKLDKIAEIHPYAKMLRQASRAIILCIEQKSMFSPQDCGAATENILLRAADLGLGTCWCGVYPNKELEQALQKALGIRETPFNVIALGVPGESPAPRGFFDRKKVIYL